MMNESSARLEAGVDAAIPSPVGERGSGPAESREQTFLSVAQLETQAREVLPAGGFDNHFGREGAPTWETLTANRWAFQRRLIRGRVLAGVVEPDISTSILGKPSPLPVMISPAGGQQRFHPEGEGAMVEAAAKTGIPMGLSTLSTLSLEEVRDRAPSARLLFQLYMLRDEYVTNDLVSRAEEQGYEAIILTVDHIVGARRFPERAALHGVSDVSPIVWPHLNGPPRWANVEKYRGTKHEIPEVFGQAIQPSLTWDDVTKLRARTSLPIVIKGIQTPADAISAVDHGADAVIVSNHGGVPPSMGAMAPCLEALPQIKEAVGNGMEIYLDSGVRSGVDVFKALSLGADAVLVGRAALWALAVGGRAGVRRVVDILSDELSSTLALTGCQTVNDVARADALWSGEQRW
ncbi:alpha-hydroxy acid oxidase [Microbacterium sp. A196]|uniref:alpha-hydroxy acid oxidase n=1 Tax=unclassified Microbacterium TaxID=2609290 RepID=UPI003F30CC4A